ncbi:MAG: acetolactate synthase small subunit [Desulfovibrio sp.]|jgi:acetolactate synthase-1/3 small subunit|nr:acetolactate synthase small subunit [Desulfovibrio sp.]
MATQRHVLSVLVENEPGVLSRVVGLFSGRGFNIHSLNVAPALEDGVSHMTITTYGDSFIVEQIMKQLHKIVTVIKVVDFEDIPAVEREMMFVKVQAEGPARGEILRTVEIFRCKVVDVSPSEIIIEATGVHDKLEAIIGLLQRFGIKELARTGSVAMRRSRKSD